MSDHLPIDGATLQQIVRRVDDRARLVRAERLVGGIAALAIDLAVSLSDGRSDRWVLRQHGENDLRRNPDVARDEFRLLEVVRRKGIPVPPALHLDASTTLLETPYVVLGYVEGSTRVERDELGDALEQMAVHLASIHEIRGDDQDLAFVRGNLDHLEGWLAHPPDTLDDALREGTIRVALNERWPWEQDNATTLLHGDFWPGNVLWRDGELVGVIDWEDAARGDPLADLAFARFDLLLAYGERAMGRFTELYLARADVDARMLPIWDLVAALRPAGQVDVWTSNPEGKRRLLERHAGFTDAALERLAAAGSGDPVG